MHIPLSCSNISFLPQRLNQHLRIVTTQSRTDVTKALDKVLDKTTEIGMKFQGTESYVATDDLTIAEYDAVSRLRDSQLGEEKVHDVANYIRKGKMWEAFEAGEKVVLLIDEIDKADIEFPNDLLQELDKMEFFVYETGKTIKAENRPIVIITSNNEKELPDAFLRRCFFHYIRFPDMDTMRAIVEVHHPGIKEQLLTTALTQFFEIREQVGLKKKPSTSEVLDWLKLLLAEDMTAEDLKAGSTAALPKLHGALLKNEQDVHLFERLAFMARGQR